MKNIVLSIYFLVFLFLNNSINAAEEPKILTTTIETMISSNARSAGSGNNQAFASQDWYFTFALPSDFDFEVYTGGVKQIEGASNDGTWNDSYLQIQNAIYKSDTLKFSLSARYVIPLSENSRENNHMNWGLQIRPTLLFTLYKADEFTLTFRTRPTYNEYFYSQDYANNGLYNIQRSFILANRLLARYGAVYVALIGNYVTKWNTNGDHIDDSWQTLQVLGWTVNANYYLELIHQTGNRVYDSETGRRNNIDIFDNHISSYILNVGVTF
jgi:hypothetical protein